MEFIRLNRESSIMFTMVSNENPYKALLEAKSFIVQHRLPQCELDMNGFTALIEQNSNEKQLVDEYLDWYKHNNS